MPSPWASAPRSARWCRRCPGPARRAVYSPDRGRLVLGVLVCVAGMAFSGRAGIRKEGEVSDADKRATVAEFSLGRGMVVAVVCGVMSACMAFAFAAGKPIAGAALRHGAPSLWQNLPVLIVVMAGGFLTNVVWCVFLGVKNGSPERVLRARSPPFQLPPLCPRRPHLVPPVLLLQHGHHADGRYDFSSWTLHMASISSSAPCGGWPSRSGRGRARYPSPGRRRPLPPGGFDGHCRLWQLSGRSAPCYLDFVKKLTSPEANHRLPMVRRTLLVRQLMAVMIDDDPTSSNNQAGMLVSR